jgi:hypothetical protein
MPLPEVKRVRGPRKGRRAQRYLLNLNPAAGRLRQRMAALEALINDDCFDPALSASLDPLLLALEARG